MIVGCDMSLYLNSHLHLHGRDDCNDLALFNGITGRDLDLNDLALHRRSDVAGIVWVDLGLAARPGWTLRRVPDQNGSKNVIKILLTVADYVLYHLWFLALN